MKQSNKMEIRTELIKYSKWLDKSTLPECSQTDEVDLIRNVESYLETEGNYLILSDNIKKTKMFSAHPNGGSYGDLPYIIFGYRGDTSASADEIFMSWPSGVNSNGTTPKLSAYGDAFESLKCCLPVFERLSGLENPDAMTFNDFITILVECGFKEAKY